MAATSTPPRTTSRGRAYLGASELDETVLGKLYDHHVVTRLFRYVLPYKLWGLLAVIGVIGYVATMIAQPLIVSWGVDSYIVPAFTDTADWGNIEIVALVFIANAGLNMISNFLQYFSLAKLSVNILYDLRKEMFDHLQELQTSFYDRTEVGRIMSRVQNDIQQLQQFTEIGVTTLGDIGMLLFIAGTMLWINPFLGVVALSVTPVLLVIIAIWQGYAKSSFVRVRTAISAVNGNLQENISGVRVSQSMNRQDLNLKQFDRLNTEHLYATMDAGRYTGMLMPAVEITTVISMGLVIIIGGNMVLNGSLTAGALVAFLMFVQRFFEPIRTITMQYTLFQRAMASGVRIFELLDIQPELRDRQDAKEMPQIKGEVRLENVSFGYTDGTRVLHDINLHINPGETAALVGLTGAGKTTVVSLMERFYDVGEGRILIDGYDIRDVKRESLAGQMAMVLQDPFLYSTTVKENIRYRHMDVTDEDVVRAAKAVGAHDFIMRLEDGYDTMLQQRGGNLSMGQRQLISFARAIVGNPRILILDEATANIDSHTERVIQDALKTIMQDRTSVVIAHRLSTITDADKIVVLEHGRIKEAGTHRQLMELNGEYARLHAINFGETLEGVGEDSTKQETPLPTFQQPAPDWGPGF